MKILTMVLLFAVSLPLQANQTVTAQLHKLACSSFLHDHQHIETCRVRLMLRVKPKTDWQKLACYGEIAYTGDANTTNKKSLQGFVQSIEQSTGIPWPNFFKMDINVHFPAAAKATGPAMDWYRCEVIKP